MKILLIMLLFVLEMLKYQKVYYICFSEKLSKIWVTCITGAVLLVVFSLNPNIASAGRHVIASAGVLVAMFFMMQGKWKQRLVNLLEIFFLLCCMEEIVNILLKVIKLYTKPESNIEYMDSLIIGLVLLIILYGIALWKAKRTDFSKKLWNVISAKLPYLVILMAIGMLVTISGLNYAEHYVGNLKFSMFTMFLGAVSYISIGILGIFVFYIRKVNYKMKEMLHREVLFNDMQRYYYEELLEREEDTRKYRHDMIKHLVCMNGLAQQQNVEELQGYLEQMLVQAKQIQKKCYTTGNQILDIVTNYYLGMIKCKAHIQVSGQVDGALAVDNMTLCTIYANLLQNAVEELEREECHNAFLIVKFEQGKEYSHITIQNSLSGKSKEKGDLFCTEKADKKNHGIGLKNVRKEVEDSGGKMEISHDEESFTVHIYLRNK